MAIPAADIPKFKKELISLIENEFPKDPSDQIFYEMFLNVSRLRAEKFDFAEIRLLNTALRELRHSLKVFKEYRNVPKAAIFGSARVSSSHPNFKLAVEFGRQMAKKKWMIITGGASGIMEAAMIGAGAKNCFGLNIMLPFEQIANPIIRGSKKLMLFKYFFTRKLMFLKESDATVLFPGGFGTFDEGFESFTLVQTGKAKPRPLVLIDHPGSTYWVSLLSFLKVFMEGDELISKTDFSLLRHFHTADHAAEEITCFYRNYDSSRFYKDQYLIRLRKPITNKELARLSDDFRDIIARGDIERLKDPNDDDHKDRLLHRIVFFFDRSNYSRLRILIDELNAL